MFFKIYKGCFERVILQIYGMKDMIFCNSNSFLESFDVMSF